MRELAPVPMETWYMGRFIRIGGIIWIATEEEERRGLIHEDLAIFAGWIAIIERLQREDRSSVDAGRLTLQHEEGYTHVSGKPVKVFVYKASFDGDSSSLKLPFDQKARDVTVGIGRRALPGAKVIGE